MALPRQLVAVQAPSVWRFCGADAHGTFNREDFGVAWGKNMGFDMKVNLQIQIEAIAAAK